jgi:hypothetical protein
MPQRKLTTSISMDRKGKAYLFLKSFEADARFSLPVDDQLTVTTEGDPAIDSQLPQGLQRVPLLRMVYTGQLGGPGVDKLFAFLRALRLTSSAAVFSSGTLFVEDEVHSFHAADSREWSWGASKEQIAPAECEAAAKIYSYVRRISERETEVYNRLTNAHRFFDTAYDQSNADMAIVGFTTALEGLLLNSEQELSFRFCLRLAQFLGGTTDEKRAIFERAKELYVCRSKIVHGTAIRKDSELAAIYVVDEVAPTAERLARDALLKIYEHGLAEVFESGDRVDKLFSELLFAEDSASIIRSHAPRH